ncbi:MAG: sodium:proton antiporter [Hyphomicrobiales bacterium]|nr:sodium:proton antiporter [Hyphomicrobiales bacterium]MCP5001032.1 sodium:proton antiporter [Hyphomicrobiales bacterium]
MHEIALKIALVCAAGIGAQWLAWRLQLPAIVLLLVAGFLAGPATGFLNPAADFGEIYRPLISLSVAIILFEGGLTLNFKEIRETSTTVRHIVMFGGPLVWLLTALSAHFIAGLSWTTAVVLGAILVVTGPTVIMPLLRQAQLSSRPASILRWEAIVNDPIGALLAVLSFETVLILHGDHHASDLAVRVPLALVLALVGGWAAARLIKWLFIRGHVPEYLKVPILLTVVLLAYAATNVALEEAGLLTVTVMGVALANTRLASLSEIRRFKETVTILLVSGVFILLTASLTVADIRSLDWRTVAFVASLLFVIRPLAIFAATIGSGATWQERLLTGWIAPRGIVAVAVSGLFGATLTGIGVADGSKMVAVTFAVVVATIILHGFSLGPLAAALGLKSAQKPGVLIVGGSRWATALARKLSDLEIPAMIADRAWNRISEARLANVPVYYGEVLSEEAHHTIDFNRFSYLIAAGDNDAYNALVCTDFGLEFGRSHVFQIEPGKSESERHTLNFTLGGRPLAGSPVSFWQLQANEIAGWTFQVTTLSEDFGYDAYLQSRDEKAIVLMWIKPSGKIVFASTAAGEPSAEDQVLCYAPADTEARASKRAAAMNESE